MNIEEFRRHAHELVDWMADYLSNVDSYPVRSNSRPGDVLEQIPDSPPPSGESFASIMQDFESTIVPGLTHWQSPSFMAYFTANSSPPSVLAEMLTATIGAQCMIWQTSPAAAELEERMMTWLAEMIGLSTEWSGVIQDTASTANLCALLTAREKNTGFDSNLSGLFDRRPYGIYCSTETHSSVDKAVRIAGLGSSNIRKISVRDDLSLDPVALRESIEKDISDGITPLCVFVTIGTTSTTAVDPIREIGEICRGHDIWLHVDAAYFGTALVLPEYRWMADGAELADSFVFNPHKWMFTNFDCSAYFVKDEAALVRTFEILPEYLKTSEKSRVKSYRDWGVQLGRRFRALKLWFVIRTYGVEGIQKMVRTHIEYAQKLAESIRNERDFEILAPAPLTLICFRYKPHGISDEDDLERLNSSILEKINSTGDLYLTHTKVSGKYAIRIVVSQTYVTRETVDRAWELIRRVCHEST